MADTSDKTAAERAPESSRAAPAAGTQRIFLVPYPKIIFLYPSFLTSLIIAIVLTVFSSSTVGPNDRYAVICSVVFLGVMAINLVVLSFDFPRGTSLTVFLFLASLALVATVIFILKPGYLPIVENTLLKVRPAANATFFYIVSGLFALLFVVVLGLVQFDYWEVRPNELLHHHGILSDLKRYSAPNLRIDKEINDVFEYMLMRSGRLILHPSGERHAIVLDNVPFINQKEAQITRMLGALQVKVQDDR